MVRQRIWLCIPPSVLCVFDQVVTVWGQPSFYWESQYRFAFEGAPHGRWLLQQHPLAFAGFGLLWIASYVGAILLLPRRASLVLALAVVIGHAWGACTWIMLWFPYGYWLCMLLFILTAALVVSCGERAMAEPTASRPPAGATLFRDATVNPLANGHPAPSPRAEEVL